VNAMPREAPDRQGDVPHSSSMPTTGVVVSRSVVRKPPRKGSSGDRLVDMRAAYRVAGNNGIGQLTPRNNRQRIVARAVLEMSPGSMVSEDEDADTINSNISSGSISLKHSPGNDRLLQGTSPTEGSSSHSRKRTSSVSRKLATRSRKPQSTTSVNRNQEDKGTDRSSRSERRSDRRSGGIAKSNVRRSSSRKRNGRSDTVSESVSRSRSLNEKRNCRTRRAPEAKTSVPTPSGNMNRPSVTEDEIMELLSLDYEIPLASHPKQRDRSLSRESVGNGRRISSSSHTTESSSSKCSSGSPARHRSSESFSSGDNYKPRRSGGSIGESRGIDRSNSSESFSKPQRRTTPRRAKSDDSAALASFLKQNEPVDRKKRTSTGSRSVASMPAKANQKYRRGRIEGGRGSDRTEDTDDTTIPSSVNSSLGPGPDQDSFKERMGTSGTIHYHHEEEDNLSIDLDLATARTSFQQQNLNEKLQLHLSKTDELLYSVFPKHVADSLRNGQKVEPENHDLVTIFFSDIVGFTDISSKLDPLKISDMLDRLYHSFDALSDYHDVFKVETCVWEILKDVFTLPNTD
jgi:hypothetical protein